MTPVMHHAQTLWAFLQGQPICLAPSDIIVVCGSYDLRVCDHACALIRKGIAPRMLITGATGNWTRYLWERSEADVFHDRARSLGVDEGQITLEKRATNFAENIQFSRDLLPGAGRVTFVTKRNSVLRVKHTLDVQWPEVESAVDAPAINFPDDVSHQIGVLGLIDEMVGDLHRILHYPELGYQSPITIPDEVLRAWHRLIESGFDRHLLDTPRSAPGVGSTASLDPGVRDAPDQT